MAGAAGAWKDIKADGIKYTFGGRTKAWVFTLDIIFKGEEILAFYLVFSIVRYLPSHYRPQSASRASRACLAVSHRRES